MRIRVFDEAVKTEKKKELFLALEENGDDVALKVVDEFGEDVISGLLLSIGDDGTLILFSNVNKRLGLNLTKAGYLRVTR